MLDDYGVCSGLQLNKSKLEAIYLCPPSTNFVTNFDVGTSKLRINPRILKEESKFMEMETLNYFRSFPKEIIKSANTLIYDFLWKGKDKVKRRAFINNIENGGLKMLHLE